MAPVDFYFDLGSPYAYLSAEQLVAAEGQAGTELRAGTEGQAAGLFPAPVQWRPVSLGAIFKLTGRSSWSLGDPARRAAGIAEVERRAKDRGLPAVRWPEPWPGDYLLAMRAATFASRRGVGREFALSAFRLGFQQGRDLSLAENVLAAAVSAGLDATECERAVASEQIKQALRTATDAAVRLGVRGVPTFAVDGALFWGDDRIGEAAAAAHRSPGGALSR
jgi:2-hydroxychromene-2-carboxylate isomerase